MLKSLYSLCPETITGRCRICLLYTSIGRAAFVEQLLQPYYRRLARIEGYGGEVGHLVAEDEGIVRHLEDVYKRQEKFQ